VTENVVADQAVDEEHTDRLEASPTLSNVSFVST